MKIIIIIKKKKTFIALQDNQVSAHYLSFAHHEVLGQKPPVKKCLMSV